MVPVRSELIQPELPSVSPIRLLPCEVNVPRTSGPLAVPVFWTTRVLPMVTVPLTLSMPPPLAAVLPAIVSSRAVRPATTRRPPPRLGVLLLAIVVLTTVKTPV